jgi:glycosyltransferase XagB
MPLGGYFNGARKPGKKMNIGTFILAAFSVLLTIQAAHVAWLSLYAWEDADKQALNQAPDKFIEPKLTFTVLLPARHEEQVIQGTIERVVSLNYPREMVQIITIIEAGDIGTIERVNEKIAGLRNRGINNIGLLTFGGQPINKPHGLNLGLTAATGDVVVVFDAEDEPHPDILNLVNTVMVEENVPVVQAGVQLMNYADHWFSALNVLEYFFWFKSRLHYHASAKMVPLGGNTIFMKRALLKQLRGWDEYCLTEDADLGIRTSVARIPIRIVYDDRYVTREETPHSVGQFIKQRTRWTQGFMQVLFKGDWRLLPTWRQRLLAVYTLAFPLFQALLIVYVPLSIYLILFVKMPELLAMIMFMPMYMVIAHYVINVIGLFEFTEAHGLKPGLFRPIQMAFVYMPYQWMLNIAAFRALWRQIRGVNNWEKTAHTGAHLQNVPVNVAQPGRPVQPVPPGYAVPITGKDKNKER